MSAPHHLQGSLELEPADASRFEVDGALPRTSLALEASAGTGKTWTLTALTVRYIAEDGVPLPELLLVTFTRAATAELRERVRLRIREVLDAADRAAEDPDGWTTDDAVIDRIVGDALRRDDGGTELDLRRSRLRAASQQLDEATISTIHGFCQKMLQHAALEAGVDFDAVLLDDDADLLAEIVDDHLARELRPAPADWVRYLQDCAKINRKQLGLLARAVAALPALQLRPEIDPSEEPCWTCWGEAVERFDQSWRHGGREQAVALVGQLKDDGAFIQKGQTTFTAKKAEEQAMAVDAWLKDPPELPPGKVDRTKAGHRSDEYPMAYFTVAALRTKLDPDVTLADLDVHAAAADVLEAAMAPATIFLHRAATYIWEELDRRKHQRTVLTFDDLLRRLADALDQDATRAAVRTAIRDRYRVALIDEFQDTDPVQWRIFSSLFETGEPFVLIGDPKQAIYSFRGADIHTYVDARDSRARTQTLQTNHRSDAGFVAACNQLFGQDGAFGTDDITYRAIDARHGDRLTDPTGGTPLQVRFVPRALGPTHGKQSLLKKGWADRTLPGDVAAVTVSLLEDGLTIDDEGAGQGRPVAPQDIAVLVRTNRRAHAVQRALRDAGVPAVIQRGGSVFATDEAEALQRLLAAMLRPSSERAAVVAASSILFGRDAPTLVAQREALDRHTDSAGAAVDGEPDGEDPSHEWDRWVDALTRWGERWHRSGLLPAVRMAFADDGVPERLLTTPEGERRLTNVRHLVELLHAAEVTEGLTPHACVDWLQAHRADADEGDLPTAETELRLEEDAEAVRVVTVHGSKGLQYPIVLCPDLWDGRLRVDKDHTRFHDPDIDDPSRAITLDVDADATSTGKQRSIALAEAEARAEQLRLAYVALTRAQHRCVVWWGPFGDSPTSALATLLHGQPTDDPTVDRLERSQARLESAQDPDLIDDLEALAAGTDGAIGVVVLDELGRDAAWQAGARAVPSLDARAFTRSLDFTWRRASFTSLVRNVDHHVAPAVEDPGDGRDVDAQSEHGVDTDATDASRAEPQPATSPAPELPLVDFPRGAGPGTFIHDVFERADLTRMDDDEAMDQLLAAMERRHGIDPEHRSTVLAGLRVAVDTELVPVAPGVCLADLAMGDRLNELRFELPLGGGNAHTADRLPFALRAVADLLTTSSDPVIAAYADRLRDPGLPRHVRGFLNGSIDLLARLPDGRFVVADYKSNWLGDRATGRSVAYDYRPSALHASMTDSHYVLQALLYLVATHRYLRWRIPGYDYDTHVAGAACLYVRGMVGPDTPVLDGGSCGVGAIHPDGALIRSLSQLLEGVPP